MITVLQDRQGFIWIGTQVGLFRYDSHDFIKYQHDPDDPTTLANNYVQTLFEDKSGVLWVGTAGGVLHQYQAQFDKFSRFPFDKDYPKTSRSTSVITSIAQESDTSLWVTSLGGGLSRFDLLSKQFTKNFSHLAENDNSLSDDNAYTVLQDSSGLVWIGTRDGGLNAFNPVTGHFTRYLHQPDNPDSLSHNKVYKLLEDSKGSLWIATRGGGLNRFNPTNETFTRYQYHPDKAESLSSDLVFSIYEDNAGALWVGTYNEGLNRFNPTTQSFSRYLHDPLNKKSLGSNKVWAITQDHTGNILLGTFDGELSFFNPESRRFGLNRHQPSNINSLSQSSIHAIYKDKQGILWVGSTAGLDRYDEAKDEWLHYKEQPDTHLKSAPVLQSQPKSATETKLDVSISLNISDVSAIFEDSFGQLWVGTHNGLNQVKRFGKNGKPLEPKDYAFIHYKNSSNNDHSLSDNFVLTIHEDNTRQLWVGTQNGLNRFDREQKKFTRFMHDKNQPNSVSSNIINTIFTDKEGRLWIGTHSGGLNLFIDNQSDKDNNKKYLSQYFIRFQHKPEDNNSLSSNTIYAVAQDSLGILWLGTTVGLNRFNPETEIISHLRMKDGLTNNVVMHVKVDKMDNIWLGYNEPGLSFLHPDVANKRVKMNIVNNIGAEVDCEASQGGSYQWQDGKLYWGSAGQYCAFYPEQVITKSKSPTVVITDFKLLNKSVPVSRKNKPTPLKKAINQVANITLGYEDNILSFEFAALHFTNSKANQYRYKLEGFNKDWVETDWKDRHATYTNLAAGNYTFTVKASNNEGKWNEKGRSIQLIILPPPWKTWWAYTLYGLFILSFIHFFVRVQRKKVHFERQLNAQLESKVAERTIALQSSNENLEAVNNQLEQVNIQLEELSLTDQLTGLRNRRFLVNNLENDINIILRKHKKANLKNVADSLKESDLIFFLIDLDHFKQVNDLHGHSAGDAVLIQIKAILASVFRETDYLVRWGGEEFLVVARFTDTDRAPVLAERLRTAVEGHRFDIGQGNFLSKTCSIGYASYPFIKEKPDSLDWERVVDIADHCLYAAKKSNRNAWVGLENVNCIEENIFPNITVKTQALINARQIKASSSLQHEIIIKWD